METEVIATGGVGLTAFVGAVYAVVVKLGHLVDQAKELAAVATDAVRSNDERIDRQNDLLAVLAEREVLSDA